jgi:3-oxoacyl-[acyl-carrier-protein] synthase III
MAILFATSDGGVNYTRRFFDGLHLAGTGSGSPLLFPETVYNAPASHIAAHFGSDQEASAIVGDSATGLTALSAAFQLLKSGMANSVLVVAANECDAISAAGYSRWKFLRQSGSDSGHVFSEMAAAIILSLTPSSTCLRWVKEGACFASKTQAENRLKEMLGSPSSASRMISCGSSFMQDCEGENSDSRVNMKPSLGEALAASSLAQVVAAAHWSQSESADVFLSSLGFGGSLAAAEVGPA